MESQQPTVAAWAAHQLAGEILREVNAKCAAASIPFLAVKGVVTSRFLYEDVAERPIVDVDIRVRGGDLRRLVAVATAAGWRCWETSWSYRSRAYGFGDLSLDVESDIGPPGLCALTVDAMLTRAASCAVAPGMSVLAPEIHDHAVLLTLNVFKDRFAGNPASVSDLERIVQHPDFRRDTFVRRAVDSGVATPTWIVARWLETTRSIGAWAGIRQSMDAVASVRQTYAKLYRRLAGSSVAASLPAYFVAAAGADARSRQVLALGSALAWTAETWLRARTSPVMRKTNPWR